LRPQLGSASNRFPGAAWEKQAGIIVFFCVGCQADAVTAAGVVGDLRAEGDELDGFVRDLDAQGWATPTPAPGWTIAHQVAHLAWTDDIALLAATDPGGFQAEVQRVVAAGTFETHIDHSAAEGAARPDLLAHWRERRGTLATALEGVPPGVKLPWFGPPMSATTMATARLMETWAHGQDVADALGVTRLPSARLRHVAHLGVRTRDFGYAIRNRPRPAEEFRVELTGPADELWTWGPEDAGQRVTGPALDFCLLVTQRRHRDDLALTAEGADADGWLDIAQAFAGPPGSGRSPGQLG
jgi:uncharacterized protein (TIGR03084 family)